jgi:hypothetical protein
VPSSANRLQFDLLGRCRGTRIENPSVDFLAVNGDVIGGRETQSDLLAVNRYDGYQDAITDEDLLSDSPG